jgi:poly(hydroxyalkanoate) depolymerase family esterase
VARAEDVAITSKSCFRRDDRDFGASVEETKDFGGLRIASRVKAGNNFGSPVFPLLHRAPDGRFLPLTLASNRFLLQCSNRTPPSPLPDFPSVASALANESTGMRPLPDLSGLPGLNPAPDRLADLDAFGSNPGQLRARTYIPKGLPARAPLVVVLHGCTQTAHAYDHGSGWSSLADRHGFALLFPEQLRANNPNLCFNWFVPGDSRRDEGEPLSIRQMIETVAVAHEIDRQRIFITGLSAGGAMTSVMLATYPELFAGGAIIAGLPYGCAKTMPEAFERMRAGSGQTESELHALVRGASDHAGPWPRVSIWHGSADHTVHPANADALLRQWRAVHGLAENPTRTEMVDNYPRGVWCDGAGNALVDAYSITGMGHGTPLATRGREACGAGGAHMLEANISSTRHIARFWGLLSSVTVHANAFRRNEAPHAAQARHTAEQAAASSWSDPVAGIHKTITDALRAAGLMK